MANLSPTVFVERASSVKCVVFFFLICSILISIRSCRLQVLAVSDFQSIVSDLHVFCWENESSKRNCVTPMYTHTLFVYNGNKIIGLAFDDKFSDDGNVSICRRV